MYRSSILAAAGVAMIAGSLYAQREVSERRASMRPGGNPDEGKCTIEVVVDGAAEVEIRGEVAVLRTLRGQPAQWRRFECNGVIPPNPVNFRFIGVDGRGKQELTRDPRNGGLAVVRIEDPNGGAEGYKFDLVWNGRVGPPPGAFRERRAISADEAVRLCQDEIRHQGVERFHVPVVDFHNSHLDDNPGRNDWVVGELEVHPGGRPPEVHRFSCSMNLATGELRSAKIEGEPPPAPSGRPALSQDSPAIPACQLAVERRLRGEGYLRVSVGQMQVDNRPGTDDWIGGVATAERRGQEDRFEYSCSVDLRRGTVRTVDLRPR